MDSMEIKEEQLNIEPPMDAEEWKMWLFKENIRLSSKEKELEEMQKQFEKEKEQFRAEMKAWSNKIRFEKTRLEQESAFFDKKFKLLEQGFKQLAADKDKFAAEKRTFEYRQKFYKQVDETNQQSFFVRGVKNQLGLKKRYKDLMKIFHPDNMGGDHETVGQINREYESLKAFFEKK